MDVRELEASFNRVGQEDNDALLKYWEGLIASYDAKAQGNQWQAYKKSLSEQVKNKGNEALGAGDNGLAILWFSLAILLDPSNYIFYSNRSAAYSNCGKYREALEDAEKVIRINPQWGKGYSRKGLAQFFLERYEEALDTYKKGLEVEPENEILKNSIQNVKDRIIVVDLNERGEAALAKGRVSEALNWFDQGIAKDPNYFLLYINRCEARLAAGQYPQALDDANKTIELRPDWVKGYQKRAQGLVSLRRFEEAASTCAHALRMDPTNQALQKLLNQAVQENIAQRNKENYEKQRKEKEEKEKAEKKDTSNDSKKTKKGK